MNSNPIDLVGLFQLDEATGSAWLHNTLMVPATQTMYGIADSNHNEIPTLSWDIKGPLVLSILGGIQDIVRDQLKSMDLYNEFMSILPSFNIR